MSTGASARDIPTGRTIDSSCVFHSSSCANSAHELSERRPRALAAPPTSPRAPNCLVPLPSRALLRALNAHSCRPPHALLPICVAQPETAVPMKITAAILASAVTAGSANLMGSGYKTELYVSRSPGAPHSGALPPPFSPPISRARRVGLDFPPCSALTTVVCPPPPASRSGLAAAQTRLR